MEHDGGVLTLTSYADSQTSAMKSSKQKPRSMPCRYCSDVFNRREHLERHERTHTKEKPFACACGRAFGRRDLLIRHSRLVHGDGSRSIMTGVSAPLPSQRQDPLKTSPTNQEIEPSSSAMEFQTFSSNTRPNIGHTRNSCPISGYQNLEDQNVEMSEGNVSKFLYDNIVDGAIVASGDQGVVVSPEYNLFLDDYNFVNFYLPAALFDSDLPTSFWSQPDWNISAGLQDQISNNNGQSENQNESISRFGSRLPSLEPEASAQDHQTVPQAYSRSSEPSWKVTGQAYREIQTKISSFHSVLPEDFNLPSRHALTRFIEGYITGFHRHLPFLHSPTFAPTKCVPELLLAICAVGAQYRFESWTATHLWYAARAVAMEQKRQRSSQAGPALKSSTPFGRSTPCRSPSFVRAGSTSMDDKPGDTRTSKVSFDPRDPDSQARLGTVQTILILMAMGMWSHRELLDEATLLQGQLALLLRGRGSYLDSPQSQRDNWQDWICFESDCRTRCIAYCFFNLYSIAYDTTPVVLAPEVDIDLPQSAEMWRAASATEWRALQVESPSTSIRFQSALRLLFSSSREDTLPQVSSLGSYALIGAIIQQIYLTRQASRTMILSTGGCGLRADDIEIFERTLKKWQLGWEQTPESSLDPTNPHGPVAFSSTALLRLAYIRLHCDLGPHRALGSRNPQAITEALEAAPNFARGAHLNRAVIHAAHALSIPVKIGVNYVAHTQTLLWSMQHALVNLECAYLLSKWLQTIADFVPNLTSDEESLLQMVRSIVNETQFMVSFNSNGASKPINVRKLGVAVVRVWAETFSGSHHVFPLVRVIGEALDTYADRLEAII